MKKEYLNKLSQLDRIEYKLREKEIEFTSLILFYTKLIMSLLAFCMIFDIFIKVVYDKVINLTLSMMSSKFFELTIFVFICAEIASLLIWRYKQKKLDKEFFEFSFEIKPKEEKTNGSKSSRKKGRS